MKSNRLQDAIGEIRDDFIADADTKTARKNNKIVRWGAMAACLCLAIIGVLSLNDRPDTPQGENDTQKGTVYTDKIVLPEADGDAQVDMIGCLVYKGSVYTQSTDFSGDASKVKHLIGDYIGEAKGTLDEWSTQDEFATELASTYTGSVYTVKGYSEDFRLCICTKCDDGEWIQFLDNYDGIGLSKGKDLFEDRLHIKGNVKQVTFLTHYDWNNANPESYNYKKLDKITSEQLDEFVEILCSSPFERIDYNKNPDFYEAEAQGHLYLELNDGTQVELRLIDGGYVGCQQLGWFFVKMPGELFCAVLSACN